MTITERGPGEALAQAEIPRQGGFTEPLFVIDGDASPQTIVGLLEYRIQFNSDPLGMLSDLRRFKATPSTPHATVNTESLEPDKIWQDLTDLSRETSYSFDFDSGTRKAIQLDGDYRRLMRQKGPGYGVELRARCLEIFLERLVLARGLGKTSVSDKPAE